MKIKKASSLLSPLAKVLNIKSDSKEDTYSCDYINDKWEEIENIQALPEGGTTGQVLTKKSETDGDAEWKDTVEEVQVSSTQPTTGEKVWFKRCRNEFDTRLVSDTSTGGFTQQKEWNDDSNWRFVWLDNLKQNTAYTMTINNRNSNMSIVGSGNNVLDVLAIEDRTQITFNTGTYERIGLSVHINDIDTVMINKGTTALPYEEYMESSIYTKNNEGEYEEFIKDVGIKISSNKPTNREKIWIRKGKNLYDTKKIQPGTLDNHSGVPCYQNEAHIRSNIDGTIIFNSSRYWTGFFSDFIEVDTINYVLNCTSDRLGMFYFIDTYDENYNFISSITSTTPPLSFTISNNNIKYIRVVIEIADEESNLNTDIMISNIQLESGTFATPYEAYVKPTILIKNDNGIYEEFMKQNNEVVLFEGRSTGDLTLNDNASSYSKFKVYGIGIDGIYTYIEMFNPNGKTGNMSATILYEDGVYQSTLNFKIDGNSILKSQNYNAVNRSNEYRRYSENQNYITKVIGII